MSRSRQLYNSIDDYFNDICLTDVYGTARSILAFGTLSTLLFSSSDDLFDRELFFINASNTFLDSLNIFWVFGYDNITITYNISVLILICVVCGFYPRLTGFLHWIVAFSFNYACAIPDGGDQIAMVLSFLLVPVTMVDSRINHFRRKQTNLGRLPRVLSTIFLKILVPLQFAVIYFHAAVEKLYKVEEWRNGTALYYIMNDSLFGSALSESLFIDLLSYRFIVLPMTWGAILIELILFGALFMRYDRRKYFLLLGVLFHFGIIIIFGLFSFFCSMTAGLLIYLLNPSKELYTKNRKLTTLS